MPQELYPKNNMPFAFAPFSANRRNLHWLPLLAAALSFCVSSAGAAITFPRIHDPSTVVKCDGRYYVFGTGPGIPFLVSSDGFSWERAGHVFKQIPDSVHKFVPKNDGRMVWAPDIIHLNGRYYLYYAVSHWGQFVSAVGLETNPTLNPKDPNYKWSDRGMVVHSTEGENLNAIDPGVIHAPDGTLWLCYGSYHGNIELVQLDPTTGLRKSADSRVWIIADHSEASDIIFHDGYYYLFVNHGSCCKGADSTYNIRVGRSKSVTGPYLDRHGTNLAKGGGSLFAASRGNLIGPGHFGLLQLHGAEKFSCHYEADLVRGGKSVLAVQPLTWTKDGWPEPGHYIADGTYQLQSRRSGNVIMLSNKKKDTGFVLSTGPYLARGYQQWTFTKMGGGLYQITSAGTKNALTVTDVSSDNGVNPRLNLEPSTRSVDQLWHVEELPDGTYRVSPKNSSEVLTEVPLIKSLAGVALRPYNGDDSQRWTIATP